MTTAKPQQMVGQSDSADDLIAELAKLMAQDTHGAAPRPASAQPSPQAIPTPSVRIPGMAPTFDAAPVQQPTPSRVEAVEPKPSAAPEPFAFDFNLSPAPRPAAIQPAVLQQPAPQPAAPIPAQPVVPQPAAAPEADVHDTIADLIAAELNIAPEPARATVATPQVSTPERQSQTEQVAPSVSLRPAAPTPAQHISPKRPSRRCVLSI